MKTTQHFVGGIESIQNDFAGEVDPRTDRLRLANGAVATFADCTSLQIRAIDGQLWITQEGDARDVIVRPGMSYLSNRRGKLVVQALDRSVIEVRRLCEG
ncbi:MAG: DUF2917 domain-containing protein [Anaerolineae bacterium]|nr:DUF2917 domain-containing protein [Phycisphaerae bacterium]